MSLSDGSTVVIKQAVDPPPGGSATASAESRARNEIAALGYLNAIPAAARHVPKLLAFDLVINTLVLEDLGDGPSLSTLLLGDDRIAATDALLAWSRALGELNAGSIATIADFVDRRAALGHPFVSPLAASIGRWVETLADITSTPMESIAREVSRLGQDLDAPTASIGLALRDACPGNERILPDGVVFFDLEFAQAQTIALDAAQVTRPFPNCWCQGAVPADVLEAMRREYFAALATVGIDEDSMSELNAAEAALAIRDAAQSLPGALRSAEAFAYEPRIAGPRQRVGGALKALSGSTQYPSLGELATRAAVRLEKSWGPSSLDPPTFPAFAS